MSKPDHNVRPLKGAELDAVLDAVANNGAIVLRNVNTGKPPIQVDEAQAWAACATSALYLAATINKMRENAANGLPIEGGGIKAEGKKRKKTGVKK